MQKVSGLPSKLDMLLKASSLSRVALAHKVGVDKSLVGRWVKGSIHPGEHNLSRLTAVFQDHFAHLTLADWYLEEAEMAERLGISRRSLDKSPNEVCADSPFARIAEASGPELALRAECYEGFWRTARPSVLMPDQVFHDYGLFRRREDGMMEVIMEGAGLRFEGWLFPMSGNLYVFLFDPVGRTPLIVLMKGVSLPRAISMDGLLLLSALDGNRTPAALPIVVERLGDLSGDRQADDEAIRRMVDEKPEPMDPVPSDRLREKLYADVGPAAKDAGKDLFLIATGALSRGTTQAGLLG
ncbi:hypothetical protein GCM10010990_30220 [Croceicoccus mobilis]|uniref:HTH cro/C1-type domain-containing protein n=2 Tax=Croceicoccus mobilis TaxID=1703339 RepID=A0A916Z763_9SPHN|nr:helix-turn-helix transcriptional regulator [Croceicoccus mobilis]GGD78328.1 hypothetical protein GCM10010990_30220 [Croceicoccus mobilis]